MWGFLSLPSIRCDRKVNNCCHFMHGFLILSADIHRSWEICWTVLQVSFSENSPDLFWGSRKGVPIIVQAPKFVHATRGEVFFFSFLRGEAWADRQTLPDFMYAKSCQRDVCCLEENKLLAQRATLLRENKPFLCKINLRGKVSRLGAFISDKRELVLKRFSISASPDVERKEHTKNEWVRTAVTGIDVLSLRKANTIAEKSARKTGIRSGNREKYHQPISGQNILLPDFSCDGETSIAIRTFVGRIFRCAFNNPI